MYKLLSLCLVLFQNSSLFGQGDYPKPNTKDLLFYIQHNRGKNTYLYTINKDYNGIIEKDEPIKVSRQLFDNNGEIRPLTTIQRKFAYGIESEQTSPTLYEVYLVSYPNQKLYLKNFNSSNPYVETIINGLHMKVNRLFIVQKEGTFGLNTKVDHIIFFGTDKSGKNVQSKLIPD